MKKRAIIMVAAILAVMAMCVGGYYTYKWKSYLRYKPPAKEGPLSAIFFSPQGDEIAPTIEGITVMFDRPMVGLEALDGAIEQAIPLKIDPTVDGKFHWLGTSSFIFKPSARLPFATEFSVVIPKDIEALDGHRLAEDVNFTFSTMRPQVRQIVSVGERQDEYPWRQVDEDPRPDIVDPKIPGAIRVIFNQPMNKADAEMKITLGTGVRTIPLSFKWNENGDMADAVPLAALNFGETLTFTVPSGIKGGEGNLETIEGKTLNLETVGDFRVEETKMKDEAEDDEENDYGFYNDDKRCIAFTSPLDRKSVEGVLELTIKDLAHNRIIESINNPKVEYREEVIHAQSDDKDEDKNWFRKICAIDVPDRYYASYDLHLMGPIKDRYGRVLEAGETSGAHAIWETKHAPAGLFPVGPPLFEVHDRKADVTAIFNATNMREVTVLVKKVSPEEWLKFGSKTQIDGADQKKIETDGTYDKAERIKINLKESFGGDYSSSGIYLLGLRGTPLAQIVKNKYLDRTSLNKTLLITNTMMGMKKAADEVLVWAADLSTADPRVDKKISLFVKPAVNLPYKRALEARTDADGIAVFRLDKILGYSDIAAVYEDENDVSIVRDDDDDGISAYNFSLQYSPLDSKKNYFAYIKTDRPLYRPGQQIMFSAVLRRVDEAKYFLPKEVSEIEWWVEDPKGTEIARDKAKVSASGIASAKFEVGGETATRGDWKISVKVPGRNQAFSKVFTVASYRKPDFKLTIEPREKETLNKQPIEAKITGKYFFGAPLSGASLEWNMTTETYSFDPKGYDEYSFGDLMNLYTGREFPEGEAQIYSDYEFDELSHGESYYSESSSQSDSDKGSETSRSIGVPLKNPDGKTVGAVSDRFSKSGDYTISYVPDLAKYPSSQIITLAAMASDESRQQISAYADIVVHKGDFYIGLKPTALVYKAKAAGELKLVTVGTDDSPKPGKKITVELVRRTWNHVKKQEPDRSFSSSYQPVDKKESAQSVVTGPDGAAVVKFTPMDGGEYWIVARSKDSRGNDVRSSTDVWVSSEELVAWDSVAKNRVDLVADKDSYAVGETAHILVKAPMANQKALLTIERGRVISHKIIDLRSNSDVIDLKITDQMVPNAYVGMMLFRAAGGNVPEFKAGYLEIRVSPEKRRLNIAISSDKEIYRPKDKVAVNMKVSDHKGASKKANLILSVVDESVLRLVDYKSPDLVKHFYYPRTLGVRSADNMTQFKAGDGGFGKELAKKRSKFLDTAYFNSDIVTNENGEATVEFDLPDNLTTWVVEAVAVSEDTLVGSTGESFVATMPFFIRAELPRFLSLNDEARPSVIIENQSNEDAVGVLSIETSGGVGLKNGLPINETVNVPKTGSKVIPFDVIASLAGDARFSFAMRDESGAVIDEVEQSLRVEDRSVPEVVSMAGSVEDSIFEQVKLPGGIPKKDGALTIDISSTLVQKLKEAEKYLVSYPYGCAEQLASAVLADVIAFELKLGSEDFLKSAIQAGIAKLYGLQESYGAFRFWPESLRVDPYLTDYVLFVLGRARKANFSVDQGVFERAANSFAANSRRKEFTAYMSNKSNRVFHAFVISEISEGINDGAIDALFKDFSTNRSNWSVTDMSLFAIASSRSKRMDIRDKVLGALEAEIHPTPRGVTWKEYRDRYVCGFDCQTAIVLKALLETRSDHPLIEKTARQLISAERKGYWENTHATLWAMDALSEYMKRAGGMEPDFVARVLLDGSTIAEEPFDRNSMEKVVQKIIPLTELPDGEAIPIEISKKGVGRLYYDAELKYYLPVQAAPTREEGVIVRRDFFELADKKEERPITKFKAGENYKSSVTVVVPAVRKELMVEDLLPAGLEPMDSKLSGANREAIRLMMDSDTSEKSFLEERRIMLESPYWYPLVFAKEQTMDDRKFWAADEVPAGVYHFRHVVRAMTPGIFMAAGARAFEMYRPEIFGRGVSRVIEISE